MLAGSDQSHGFGYVSKEQLKASNQNATYYGFTKGKFRILMLDTNAEGGGASGNIDDPQFQWLKRQLDKVLHRRDPQRQGQARQWQEQDADHLVAPHAGHDGQPDAG